jgi:hypothetical protein
MMIIIVAVVILLLLAGGGYYLMNKSNMKPASETSMMQPKASPTSAGMFASIKDALSKSLSLQCAFTDDQTNAKTTAYLKSGAIRGDVTGKTPTENSSFIMKDKMMYFWTGKQGMKMAFNPDEMKEMMPSVSPSTQKPTGMSGGENGANMIEMLEKFKDSCKPAVIEDALFVPPSDVTFQDLSKMMPSGAMMAKPSGTMPSDMTQEQAKEMEKQMMQKYNITPPAGK